MLKGYFGHYGHFPKLYLLQNFAEDMPANSLSLIFHLFTVNSGMHSKFTDGPAGSADRVLSCKLNGKGLNLIIVFSWVG